MKPIFMDHASTTPVDKQVLKAMRPYFEKNYGNASSLHQYGRKTSEAIERSRRQIAALLQAHPDEIIFTSGGTESDNLALKGITCLNKETRNTPGAHIITSAIEHPAVLEPCKYLEKQGFNITYLPVDSHGLINTEELSESITNDTFLISVMYANNEIGTIEPIKEIGKLAHDHDVIFHTDAIQAIGKTTIDVDDLNIDLLSISSHKIYGPKGVGCLYIRNGVKIQPIIHGGGHERGLRSGTYNTPGIVGLGKACELARMRMKKDTAYLKKLRDQLIRKVLKIEESYLNGHPEKRLINNAHFRFKAVEGESLLFMLDERGIAAATGSACSSAKLQASHVLTALGLDPVAAHGSLRLTLGRENTMDDINYVIEVLPEVVAKLRAISPLWNT